jgi:hypothetical protein
MAEHSAILPLQGAQPTHSLGGLLVAVSDRIQGDLVTLLHALPDQAPADRYVMCSVMGAVYAHVGSLRLVP